MSDPSLLIADINSYRGWLDFATAIVVVGLLGEYRKDIRKVWAAYWAYPIRWREVATEFLRLSFPLMVVAGVSGELFINVRVSALENKWEISELPRDLNDNQQKDIAGKIRSFSGMHFDFEMQQDLEPMRLLDKIENALLLAGWKEQAPRSDHAQFDRVNRPKVGVGRTVAGVWVLWPEPAGEPFKSAAKTLVGALIDNGITASLITVTHPDEYDSDKIHVWVGVRP